MVNETVNTTNKLIKPEDIPESDDEVIRQLSDNLQDVTPEDIDAMCDEIEEEKKKLEIPQELKDYRQAWRERISYLSDDFKNNLDDILQKLDQIPLKVEIESDGSRLIELKLGGKIRKILDPKLCNHTDVEFCNDWGDMNEVKLRGMRGDDVDNRENKLLADYVKEKKQKGLYIPPEYEMKKLLAELGKEINSDKLSDQIAMLMYLTGIHGRYWLYNGYWYAADSRPQLRCHYDARNFDRVSRANSSASLCMLACE